MLHRLRSHLRYLFDGRRIDRDLAEELEIHQAMLTEDQQRRIQREGAALNARRKMGNTAVMADYARDAWIMAWLDTLARDARYAWLGDGGVHNPRAPRARRRCRHGAQIAAL
jgi:hypothetical protein